MSKLPKNNGLKLFLKCSKEVKKEFEKQGRTEKWNEIQKWTSANVFPKFKGQSVNKVSLSDINSEIKSVLGIQKKAPEKKSPCFSVFAVRDRDITNIDWWDIENVIQGLPPNVQIRVNGTGQFGRTQIDQAQNISIESDVNPIVEKIREFVENKSGLEFIPLFKLVPDKKDDGSNCSYFIDFVLGSDNSVFEYEGTVVDDRDVEEKDLDSVERQKKIKAEKTKSKREKMKEARARKRPTSTEPITPETAPETAPETQMPTKVKKDKAKKKKEKVKKKKKFTKSSPKKQPKKQQDSQAIAKALELLREDFKDGVFTVEEYKKERAKLINKLESGGVI